MAQYESARDYFAALEQQTRQLLASLEEADRAVEGAEACMAALEESEGELLLQDRRELSRSLEGALSALKIFLEGSL